MAYMSQEHKARIAAELKKVIPVDWKYSLSVKHHSEILLTIAAAPVDLIAEMNKVIREKNRSPWDQQEHKDYAQLNQYYLENQFSGELLETFEKIKSALNLNNYDRSEIQIDHHDVGHYVSIHIGRWDKPFEFISGKRELTYDELKARIAQLECKEGAQ